MSLLTYTTTLSPGSRVYIFAGIFVVAKHDSYLLQKNGNCASLSCTIGNNTSPDGTPADTAIFFHIKFCPSYLQQKNIVLAVLLTVA